MNHTSINIRLLIGAIIIALAWVMFSYIAISSRTKTLKHETYLETSHEMKRSLELFTSEKQEAISLISFSLSHDSKLKQALLKNDTSFLNLQEFSLLLKQNTLLKNIGIQLILPDGRSLYRSWSDKKGDDLSTVRLDVAQVIKTPKIINAISVGKFDLSFKSMVPIYDNNRFIGLVETIAKFNSIAIKMQSKGFDIVGLVDKSYKSQLKFPFTKKFINDYYVANLNAKPELTEFIQDKDIKELMTTQEYTVVKSINKLMTVFYLNDVDNNPMSYFFIFNDLNNIDLSDIYRIRDRLVIAAILSFLLLMSGFYYFYTRRYKNFINKLNKQLEDEVALKTIELKEQNKNLEHLANHDPLTKLPNRLLFLDRLEQSLRYAKRHTTSVTVLFLDLDRFKEVNDTFGHEAGDKVLKEITQRLSESVRDYDTIARLGGDEFTLIIDGASNQSIVHIIEKIVKKIKEPILINSHSLHTSFSIGISRFPEDGDSTEILLRNADTAMYKAKDLGRDSYTFYNESMTEEVLKRVTLETDLRKSIKTGGFEAYYQPKVNAITKKVTGMEALIRWNHETLGMISPFEFIPLAEEIGLIGQIDEWMMRETMRQVLQWRKEDVYIGKLSLNVSVKQLEQKGFFDYIKTIIEEETFMPELLELEVTEGQIMKDPESTISVLEKIRNLGITISIDDFGTGYSSLSYLKRLPIDKLKIDKSFIQDIPKNEDETAIVKAIIVLAQSLNLKIIAEGVETEEQKNFLVEAGCPDVQGYYYSKPLCAHEYKDFVIQNS